MRVYVIRHSIPEAPADADEKATRGTGADGFDPPLTDEGRELMQALADWMLENSELPLRMYVSPELRAQETGEVLREALGMKDDVVKVDGSIGPKSSLRGLVMQIAADEDIHRPVIVTHLETIKNGLRELNESEDKVDPMAQGELRVLRVKRSSGNWRERYRILPSMLGKVDHYG
jgi:phosphohistidine phosphatase